MIASAAATCCASQGQRLFRDGPDRIDIVKVNTFHFIYVWIHVPRHGDIDDEKRTIQTLRSIGASISWVSNGVSDAVDVSKISISRHCAVQSSNGTARPPTACASSPARSSRAITDAKISDAARDKRARRALADFTRSEHEHLTLA